MTNEEILNKVVALKKGAYVKLIKTKDLPNGIVKYTSMIIRVGVDYANMKVNKGKEIGKLPWGQWLKDYEGLVITHKDNYYLRIATTYVHSSISTFKQNGVEISKEQAMEQIGSAVNGSKQSDVYNIKFSNIEQIG